MSRKAAERAAKLYADAVQQFQQGRHTQAQELCKQALRHVPGHPDALHLLGILALQSGQHAAAVELLQRVVAIRPDHPDAHTNLAYGYVGLKRLPEALAAFERAARLDPANAELQLGIGNCLAMMERAPEAEAVFRRLTARRPDYPLAWFNLANALKDQERFEEACDAYVRVTQLAPQLAEAHCNLGIAAHALERFEQAEQAFRAGIARNPDFIPAYIGLAITLDNVRRHSEAEALCREALARDPGQGNAWPVLGKALVGQGRWREALRCFQESVKAHPGSSDAFGKLGDALARTGRMAEALAAFDRAYAIGNVSPIVRFFKASALFSAGRIAEGAAEFMGRHERVTLVAQHPERTIADELPPDLRGREVGLIGEQGVGDELFFLRYAPRLNLRGCRLSYCGNEKIAAILTRTAAVERASSSFGTIAAADCWVAVGDLPHLLARPQLSPWPAHAAPLRTDAAVSVPAARWPWHCRLYWPELPPPLPLQPLPELVASVTERLHRLGPPPYVGLTWRAGTRPQEQRGQVWFLYKESPLPRLAAALRDTDGTLLSLQRHPGAGETEQLAALTGRPVHDLSAANDDLEDMLALLAVIDDYIGVSNTNMHLRAGVGRRARVLVPWPAEWRWMTAGDASPWFPGFRIYRQSPDGEWAGAFDRLAQDLLAQFGPLRS